MDEMLVIIETHKPAVFGIGEANIGVHSHAPALEISGYSLERDNLTANNIRNRTVAYISDKVSYKRRLDLEILCTPLIWIEINSVKPKSWLLAIGYGQWCTLESKKKKDKAISRSIPAQVDRLNNWGKSFEKANNEGKQIVIVGDLNIDVEPWLFPMKTPTPYQNDMFPLLSKLQELSNQLNLSLIKTDYTRAQGSAKPSTLDIILSSHPELIEAPTLLHSSSDHKMILFAKNAKIKQLKQPTRRGRSYVHYSKAQLLSLLNMPKLNSLLNSTCTNHVTNTLIEEITRVLDIVAPIKTIQIRNHYAAYLSAATKELMTKRDKVKKMANITKKIEDHTAYKKMK